MATQSTRTKFVAGGVAAFIAASAAVWASVTPPPAPPAQQLASIFYPATAVIAGAPNVGPLNAPAVTPPQSGATWYLSPIGSDSNPCTKGQPCFSLGRGSQVAAPGDEVLLAPGVYNEAPQTIGAGGTASAPITYTAAHPDTVLIQRPAPASDASQQSRLLAIKAGYLTFENLAWDGMRDPARTDYNPNDVLGGMVGVTPNATQLGYGEVEGVGDHATPGLLLVGDIVEHARNVCFKAGFTITLEYDYAYDCGTYASDHGVYVPDGGVTVDRSIVNTAPGEGIQSYNGPVTITNNIVVGASTEGILANVGPTLIRGNTIYDNHRGIVAGDTTTNGMTTTTPITIADNIIADNQLSPGGAGGIEAQSLGNLVIVNNTVYANTCDLCVSNGSPNGLPETLRDNLFMDNSGNSNVGTTVAPGPDYDLLWHIHNLAGYNGSGALAAHDIQADPLLADESLLPGASVAYTSTLQALCPLAGSPLLGASDPAYGPAYGSDIGAIQGVCDSVAYSWTPPSAYTHSQSYTFPVTIANDGMNTLAAGGASPYHLSVYFGATDSLASDDTAASKSGRLALPADLAPGQTETVQVTVPAPATAGTYYLHAQLVHEGIRWLLPASSKGAVTVT